MKYLCYILTGLWLASLLPGCEIHDDIDVDVKRKAIVYLRYNYNDGEHDTMDEVQTLRLFFFDLKTGRQYRDTTLTRDEFLTDTGAMQTYISNGEYGIVTLANVGHGSSVSADNIRDAAITFPGTGADPLFFNRIQTPIQKGDSLRFDIDLFKSVYKVNVRVEGMQNINNPEDFYFGLNNYAALSFDNKPCGGFRMYRPQLARDPPCRDRFTRPTFLRTRQSQSASIPMIPPRFTGMNSLWPRYNATWKSPLIRDTTSR